VHNLLIRTDLLLSNNFDFIVSLWKFGNLFIICEKVSFLRNIYNENERAAYVDNIILKSDRSNIAKLRICAHSLEIEKGRYFQINRTDPI
jgi:hypothetical protein